MEELAGAVGKAFNQNTYKCVLGGPAAGGRYRKLTLTRLDGFWQAERFAQTQVFHENMSFDGAAAAALGGLGGEFSTLNAWDDQQEHSIKISKKGKVLYSRRRAGDDAPRQAAGHNREKNYILPQGRVIAPLADMGIFTAEGRVAAQMQDKYRQINRFVEIIDDQVKKLGKRQISVLDFGCGKSYLTFVLYYYLTEIRGLEAKIIGLDLKADVIEKCRRAAEKYGYAGLDFCVGDIADFQHEGGLDMVITLHACDTATDYALFNAIKWGAGMIFSAPCCQHELNGQMQGGSLGILTRYGLIKERVAALMTDAVRANLLEYCGYRTQVLEFIDMEHTPKNIMLRAAKGGGGDRERAMAEVTALCAEFGLEPALLRLLREAGMA